MTLRLADLETAALPELEALFARNQVAPAQPAPFRGKLLRWLGTPGARHPLYRPAEALMFQRLPFGVDFARRRWFWQSPRLGVGHFSASLGPSRWRDTTALRLHYDDRLQPWALRARLYDEVKPLSDELCLGIGGMDGARGHGDHFFFALYRSA